MRIYQSYLTHLCCNIGPTVDPHLRAFHSAPGPNGPFAECINIEGAGCGDGGCISGCCGCGTSCGWDELSLMISTSKSGSAFNSCEISKTIQSVKDSRTRRQVIHTPSPTESPS
jgi:hypothetical protein